MIDKELVAILKDLVFIIERHDRYMPIPGVNDLLKKVATRISEYEKS